jgi:hypothetical protein
VFLVAAMSVFGLTPFASRLGVVIGPLLLLALSIALASAASAWLNALAVAAGALGALGSGLFMSTSAAIAGAWLVGFAFAERTMRIRSLTARLGHLGMAVVGGGLAGALASAYAGAPAGVRVVSIGVAAVLVALALLVDADDPVAHSLDTNSASLRDPARTWLREGAALRRNVDEVALDRETARSAKRTWKSLLKLADARLRLERAWAVDAARLRTPELRDASGLAGGDVVSAADAVIGMVDEKIRGHVTALVRAYTAVDTARAAGVGLDDSAARSVDASGESLEEISRAIVEIRTG